MAPGVPFRWRARLVPALATLAALALAPPASPVDGVGEAPATRVLLIGDSITAGSVSGPGVPYATVLTEELGPGFDVRNLACAGTTTRDWLPGPKSPRCEEADLFAARVEPNLPAAVAVVLLGTNDAHARSADGSLEIVDADAYGEAMVRLVGSLRAHGAQRVVLMAPPSVFHAMANFRLVDYGKQLRALCGGAGDVVCGPDLLQLLDREKHFHRRSVHPNAQGHAIIAAALAETIRSLADRPGDSGTLPSP